MWVGSLWIGSSRGTIWTTAQVTNWEPPAFKVEYPILNCLIKIRIDQESTYEEHSRKYGVWKVTSLPPLTEEKTIPTITAIFGANDNDVHVATYEVSIL